MKISSKKVAIGSFLLALSIGSVSILSLFIVNQNKVEITETTTGNQYDVNFFKNPEKSKYQGYHYSLISKINKTNVLKKFTNFNSIYDNSQLDFDEELIKNNILDFYSNLLSNEKKFKNIDQYFLQVRYSIFNKTLETDIRWGLRKQIINKKFSTLYWDKLSIKIN